MADAEDQEYQEGEGEYEEGGEEEVGAEGIEEDEDFDNALADLDEAPATDENAKIRRLHSAGSAGLNFKFICICFSSH